MKTLYRSFEIFMLALAGLLSGLYFKQQNKVLQQDTVNFDETLKEKQRLIDANSSLEKKWGKHEDVLTELSKFLITPKHEVSASSQNVYHSEEQQSTSVYENYLSGFVAYDDCVKLLEKLAEIQAPILITSLSIHRNIAHNYALQLSMTYITE